jgi:hypothetical protein
MLAYQQCHQRLQKAQSAPRRASFLVSSLSYKAQAHYSLLAKTKPCQAASLRSQSQRSSVVPTDPRIYRTLARRPNDALLTRMNCLAYTVDPVLRRSMEQGVDVTAELEAFVQEYIDELRTAGWRAAEHKQHLADYSEYYEHAVEVIEGLDLGPALNLFSYLNNVSLVYDFF